LGELLEFRQLYANPQVTLALLDLAKDFEGGGPAAIYPASLAVGRVLDFGDGAGPVEVDIRIQIPAMELVDRLGMLCGDVGKTQVFAHDRSVLGLHQTIVPRAIRARLVCSINSFPSNLETV